MDLSSAAFWAALGSIVWVNVLLSGDNAVVIALAARSLPPRQQKGAIFWGSAAAIVLRIVLTLVAVQLLQWPYLKIVGGLLLLYIGVSLLMDDDEDSLENGTAPDGSLLAAVRTILVADLVMSLDNVLAVAAAAQNDVPLLVIGLVLSVPLVIFGSTLLLKVMQRFPLLITAGAALLGYLAGEMLCTDPAVELRFGELPRAVVNSAGAVCALFVVGAGRALNQRQRPAAR